MSVRKKDSTQSWEDIINDQEILKPEICPVPSIKEYIDTHSGISFDILEAYEYKVASLIESPPEYRKNINGFISEFKEKYYHPFEVRVYGAYPLMTDWIRLKKTIKIAYDKKAQIDYVSEALAKDPDYCPIDFSQYKKPKIFERLKEYAKGYKYGFDNFITSFIDSPSALMTNSEFKIQRLFDFWSSKFSHPTSFQEININDNGNQAIEKWYEDGVKAGYDYHSWYYVFINHSFFESHFKEKELEYATTNNLNSKAIVKNAVHNKFSLISNKKSAECYTYLIENYFIDPQTSRKEFSKLFTNSKMIHKIEWIGTLNELSRFIFLLHNDEIGSSSKAVCKKVDKPFQIASLCFNWEGSSISEIQLHNNNRKLKNQLRASQISNAVNTLAIKKNK